MKVLFPDPQRKLQDGTVSSKTHHPWPKEARVPNEVSAHHFQISQAALKDIQHSYTSLCSQKLQ
jgi:hypothetical protein